MPLTETYGSLKSYIGKTYIGWPVSHITKWSLVAYHWKALSDLFIHKNSIWLWELNHNRTNWQELSVILKSSRTVDQNDWHHNYCSRLPLSEKRSEHIQTQQNPNRTYTSQIIRYQYSPYTWYKLSNNTKNCAFVRVHCILNVQ